MDDLLDQVGMSKWNAEQLCFSLSAAGRKEVNCRDLIIGCLELKEHATKIDILSLQMAVGEVSSTVLDVSAADGGGSSRQSVFAPNVKGMGTLASNATKGNLKVDMVSEEELIHRLKRICKKQWAASHPDLLATVMDVVRMVCLCEGGCGIVIAPHLAFTTLNTKVFADFQVVDRDDRFPDGYMTQRLRGIHCSDEEFFIALKEFPSHSSNDRWPEGHEAVGLPQDGYILMNPAGYRLKCAARIVGLRPPPVSWDGVGTRHLAGLSICHELKQFPSVTMIRSDSGKVHVLYYDGGKMVALCHRSLQSIQKSLEA